MSMWTFGKKVAAGFALAFVLLVGMGIVAYQSITALAQTSYAVTRTHVILEHLTEVLSLLKDAETGQRGFVITGDESYLDPYKNAVVALPATLDAVRDLVAETPTQAKRFAEIEPLVALKMAELKQTVDLRRSSGAEATVALIRGGEGKKTMDEVRRILGQMDHEERDRLRARAEEVDSSATGARSTMLFGTLFGLILVTATAFIITRSLATQIGSAVQHVRSSSAELQTAANQQVSGAKEQATAMTEITTTISELIATSRQIAESARRVAQIAGEAGTAARRGDESVTKTQDAVGTIRRQVDAIVTHMLDLGKKSQQIGGILEIINELAEQTNILAINATIEAAGAGEMGKRFSVVADEIRKLADRVGGSTKEIRGLVDDIRAAVNTTVMATEGGSKAVDLGTRQFGEVAASFKQIAGLVATTSDAAKEIELSTKQQTTAVEQVNVAVVNVSQAARETEASSTQTLQTSSQLTSLSRDLAQLIQPQEHA
jgi:methyl-accepting chemotaxis protein